MRAWVLLLASFVWVLPAAADEPPVALLTHATGEVMVRQGEEWLEVDAVPVDLFNGDKVATEQGRAEIYFWRDGSTLVLDVGTNLTLSESQEGMAGRFLRRIQIFLGDVWFELRRSFNLDTELVTPTAVGGLRGTQGLVRVLSEEESEFTLVEGELEVRQRAETGGPPTRVQRLRARQVLRALHRQGVRVQPVLILPRRLALNIPREQLPAVRENWRQLLRAAERPPALRQLRAVSTRPGFIRRELLRQELKRQLEHRERARQRMNQQRQRPSPPPERTPSRDVQRPRPVPAPAPKPAPRPG